MSRGDSAGAGVSNLVSVQRGETTHDLQLNQVTTSDGCTEETLPRMWPGYVQLYNYIAGACTCRVSIK